MKAVLKILLSAPLLALTALGQSSEQDVLDQRSSSGPIPVEVVREGGRWTLVRGGQPYVIEGAGTNGGNVAELAAKPASALALTKQLLYGLDDLGFESILEARR